MKYHFDPAEVRLLCSAFETAWRAVENEAGSANCDAMRDHMGRAIVHLASRGKLEQARLASYAAYQGRRFLGLSVASFAIQHNRAEP